MKFEQQTISYAHRQETKKEHQLLLRSLLKVGLPIVQFMNTAHFN